MYPNLETPRNTGVLRYLESRNDQHAPLIAEPTQNPDPYWYSGSHPEIVQRVWDGLGTVLPGTSRCMLYGTPALVSAHTGMVMAVALGTQYALRLSPERVEQALQRGARTSIRQASGAHWDIRQNFGPDWVFGTFEQIEAEWCRVESTPINEPAAELAF